MYHLFKLSVKHSGPLFVFLIFHGLLQLSLIECCYAQSTASGGPEFPTAETLKNSEIRYILIPANNNTWGYDIYVNNNLTIHQTVVPGIPGNNGFDIRGNAQKVAEAVILKMKNGQVPPSISIEELEKMNVLKSN